MNADAELDAALGWQARLALDEAVLHLDGASGPSAIFSLPKNLK
jgi:hypothetical protein